MYCKNCGKQLKDQASYCPYCGAAQTSQSFIFEKERDYPLPETNSGYDKALMIFAIIGLIFTFLPFHYIVLIISLLIGSNIILLLLINRKKHFIKKRDILYMLSISTVVISIFWLIYILIA